MQALSRVLMALYEAAEHVSLKAYPEEALRRIQSLIAFDGAVLGVGTAQPHEPPDLVIEQAYVHQRDRLILPEYALLSAHDPVTRYFARGLTMPFACRCSHFYREHKLPELESFCRRHALAHLMLFGDALPRPRCAQWIVLYRSYDRGFDESEKQYLMALWPHLVHALSINRKRYLDAQLDLHDRRVAALVSLRGVIEAAHPRFCHMLGLEWPGFSGSLLPGELLQSWEQGRTYAGARIRVEMRMQEELIVCVATKLHMPHRLTHAERVVASQFAGGYSHKEIAEKLGVSQHTIRSHLAHIYTKLDVHDKAALANKLSGSAGSDGDWG